MCLPLRLSIGSVLIEFDTVDVPQATVTNSLHQIKISSPLEGKKNTCTYSLCISQAFQWNLRMYMQYCIEGHFRGIQFSPLSQISGHLRTIDPQNMYDYIVYSRHDCTHPWKHWRLAIHENWTPQKFPVIRYYYANIIGRGFSSFRLPYPCQVSDEDGVLPVGFPGVDYGPS
jgi:hypothetical protein